MVEVADLPACVVLGAVTVLAGWLTVCVTVVGGAVAVAVGLGACTLSPKLLTVELLVWLTTVEGDLLSDTSAAMTTPSTAARISTGQIQRLPLRRSGWGA